MTNTHKLVLWRDWSLIGRQDLLIYKGKEKKSYLEEIEAEDEEKYSDCGR